MADFHEITCPECKGSGHGHCCDTRASMTHHMCLRCNGKKVVAKRLFVDVDDTLALYDKVGPNPFGTYMGTSYSVNEKLVWGIRDYRLRNPDTLIVVWSGGGKEYVEMWLDTLELTDLVTPMGKDGTSMALALEEPSIVVDDLEAKDFPPRTHGPFDWPEPLCFWGVCEGECICGPCGIPYCECGEDE